MEINNCREYDIIISALNKYYMNSKDRKFKNLSIEEQVKDLKKFADYLIELYEYQNDIDYEEVMVFINKTVTCLDEKAIVFEDMYVPWLEDNKDKIVWQYADRYEDYLMSIKHWDLPSVRSIGITTDQILDHCGNPLSHNNYGVKGLVIGDIQSGKTANYAGLINKAIDAGYKMVIVLAGMTKDLRSQTQKRLDLEVLGYETKDNLQKGNIVGVGKINGKVDKTIFCLTGSDLEGDITRFRQTYKMDGKTVFFAIVKKNSTVLKKLIEFIESNPTVKEASDKKLNLPALIIDDEADQASINTRDTDVMKEATTTNRLIRHLLNCMNKFSYVGYTATPFANIFISPYDDPKYTNEDKDVFPENFIICLPTPPEYSGVQDFFGTETLDENGYDNTNTDLFREIKREDLIFTFGTEDGKTKKDTNVYGLPDSLKEAIMHFLIASGAKISRGIVEHNSMLIHISKNVCPNKELKEHVELALDTLTRGFKFNDKVRKDFKHYWEHNMRPISQRRLGADFNDDWKSIENGIIEALRMITRSDTVKLIVGDSEDIIDYDSSKSGMHIIIGGDKLSRGLTLNGLIVSYYARKTKAYDTLLQMGRWFGYRKGWLDLCRVYTERSTFNDFVNTSQAVFEFKKDIKNMNDGKYTPRQFGLKIRTSPGLLPTSSTKMRTAEKTPLSFSGELQQTISFDTTLKQHNREAVENFLTSLGEPETNDKKLIYRNVDASKILSFLGNYQECKGKGRISIRYWYDYIQKLIPMNELTNWTIVLHSLSSANEKNNSFDTVCGYNIIKPSRVTRDENEIGPKINIKVLTNPLDFFEYFEGDDKERLKEAVKVYSPNNPEIKRKFGPQNALLTIYIFDIYERMAPSVGLDGKKQLNKGNVVDGATGLVGLGVWFPSSSLKEEACVDYYVNKIYQDYEQDQVNATTEDDFDYE